MLYKAGATPAGAAHSASRAGAGDCHAAQQARSSSDDTLASLRQRLQTFQGPEPQTASVPAPQCEQPAQRPAQQQQREQAPARKAAAAPAPAAKPASAPPPAAARPAGGSRLPAPPARTSRLRAPTTSSGYFTSASASARWAPGVGHPCKPSCGDDGGDVLGIWQLHRPTHLPCARLAAMQVSCSPSGCSSTTGSSHAANRRGCGEGRHSPCCCGCQQGERPPCRCRQQQDADCTCCDRQAASGVAAGTGLPHSHALQARVGGGATASGRHTLCAGHSLTACEQRALHPARRPRAGTGGGLARGGARQRQPHSQHCSPAVAGAEPGAGVWRRHQAGCVAGGRGGRRAAKEADGGGAAPGRVGRPPVRQAGASTDRC